VVLTVSKGKDMRAVENIAGFSEADLSQYARTSGFNIRT
jgi:beta-lactam-binding protein with PASTA domain